MVLFALLAIKITILILKENVNLTHLAVTTSKEYACHAVLPSPIILSSKFAKFPTVRKPTTMAVSNVYLLSLQLPPNSAASPTVSDLIAMAVFNANLSSI